MQKVIALALLLGASSILLSCSGEKKSGAGRPQYIYGSGSADNTKDSVIFYDMEVKAKQVSYKKELQGEWTVISMRRQQKADLESLAGVVLNFTPDSSFSGKAPCNKMGGIYTLKGTSIKFSNLFATKMACARLDQESAMLRLMEETVSAYTVSADRLLLRDGSSNIIFECVR